MPALATSPNGIRPAITARSRSVVMNFAESTERCRTIWREVQPTVFLAVPRILEKILFPGTHHRAEGCDAVADGSYRRAIESAIAWSIAGIEVGTPPLSLRIANPQSLTGLSGNIRA